MYPYPWPPYFPPPFNADTRFLYAPGFPPNGNPGPLPPHAPGCPCQNLTMSPRDAGTPTQAAPLDTRTATPARLVPGNFANPPAVTTSVVPASPGTNTGAGTGTDLRTTYSSLLQVLKKAEADSASNDAKVATTARRKAQLTQVFFAGLFEGAGSVPAGTFEAALQPRKPSVSSSSPYADSIAAVLTGPADTRLGPLGFALFLAACAECVGHIQGMADAMNAP